MLVPKVRKGGYILFFVTEQEGLVPSRPPVKPAIRVLRYGFCQIVETSCRVLTRHPKRLGIFRIYPGG
jgi:hypothetical protein